MTDSPTPPVDPDTDDTEEVLSVEEIDFTRYDDVHDLGDGRYVIETDGPVSGADEDEVPTQSDVNPDAAGQPDTPDAPTVYAVHANLIAGETQTEATIQTDDIIVAFDELLEEFARTVSPEMPVADTLDLLASKSNRLDRDR